MKKLNLIRRQIIELRQRRPLRAFMGCWEQTRQPANRQWVFDFIVKPNSGRAKVVMISSQPARWICGKNRGCILFQYETTQNELHEILIRLP
jgi:hypothetical protein